MKQRFRLFRILFAVDRRSYYCLSLFSFFVLAVPLFCPFSAAAEDNGVSIVDSRGETIQLEKPARRIIALYGAFNEILAAMHYEESIIARTRADKLPASILDKPVIGTHMLPNVEMIPALQPDLVLQMGGRKKALDPVFQLEERGIPVAAFDVRNFEELFSTIDSVGILTGQEKAASDLVSGMKARLAHIAEQIGEESPSIFFEVRYPNLLGAAQGSFVSDIIRKAGGRNCLQADKKFFRISEEKLLELNPQYYIMQKGVMNRNPVPVEKRPGFNVLSAAKTQHVFVVDEQLFSRPGPRSVEAVQVLFDILKK